MILPAEVEDTTHPRIAAFIITLSCNWFNIKKPKIYVKLKNLFINLFYHRLWKHLKYFSLSRHPNKLKKLGQ